MFDRTFCFHVVIAVVMGVAQASAQANSAPDKDPYRNFVGYWSGSELVISTNTRRAIALHVTEDQSSGRMRWDSWFTGGERKYGPGTKWVVLQPTKNQMHTYWEHSCNQYQRNCKVSDYMTVGLDTFNEEGFGHFTGLDGPNRFTIDLQETTLAYVLEFDDGKHSKILSKFVFHRINSLPDSDANGTAAKPGEQH